MYKDYHLKNFNFKMIFYVLILFGVSYVAIRSATSGNANAGLENKQVIGMAAGAFMILVLTFIDYHLYMKLFIPIHLMDLFLLLMVRLIGKTSKGAKRWIALTSSGSFTIQPSEFSKIMLILVMAAMMGLLAKKINKIWAILLILGVCATAWAFIYKQPDLSTTIVLIYLFVVMIYMAGISYKWILSTMAVVIPSGTVFIVMLLKGKIPESIIKPYQRNRILSFIYPQEFADQWYQQAYSIIAIGSGSLTGKGIGNDSYASVKTGNFLSEAQTDFILTIIGEEMGFIGCCAVVILLTLIVVECFITARRAIDLEGKLIAAGVGSLIAFQTLVNVAVATGMMCNTGIPLPFVSAGLSSLISMCCGVGLVLNVGMVRHEAVRTTHLVNKISPGVGDGIEVIQEVKEGSL